MILPRRRVLKVSRGVRQERVRALECVYVLHARTHTHTGVAAFMGQQCQSGKYRLTYAACRTVP